jgi:hypothetical protein
MHAPPDNLRYAQKCAALGLHVFPCNPANKKALVKWRAASSTDAKQIAKWWRKWPDALPAIDLAKSNHVVIDGDRHGGPDGVTAVENLFAEHQAALTDVPAVITPTTGKHFYFRQPNGKSIGNSDKAVRGSAINIRGAGGYAIAPGTKLADGRGYSWDKNSPNFFAALRDNAIPTIPSWLIELLARPKQQSGTTAAKPNGKSPSGKYSDRHHAYAAAALDRLSAEIAGTTEGARNIVLNNAALRLGHRIASRWIERRTVEQGLIAAATAAGLDHNEVAATLKSGIEAGLKEPHPPLQDRPSRTGAEQQRSTNDAGQKQTNHDREFLTEDALATRFASRHNHELRFVALKAQWLKWTGDTWQPENTLLAFDLARKSIRIDANEYSNSKSPAVRLTAKTVRAVEQLARADRLVAATIHQWDADDWTFN